ncbi:hypothetical protein EsDP_00007298 [Epichloe bromicola]|uniref:MutL C-terminal dimerisation domain-containing protein n=1 Tax=Epichloe bromicola TaxID=79588 RepID=A0ABQ0D084_9HYPO
MSIRPLPKDAIDKIKSSSSITSLNDVVCGLLMNSLDANSSKINIKLDFSLGNCIIEDDGFGIQPHEFEEGGGLGKLHHTSKSPPNPRIHGSHGNFIASVAAFSLLTISSRHHRHDIHSALTIHNGNVLSRSIPAQPDQRIAAFKHGTRVSVRNLFGSMPVRVKQRGLLCSDRAKIDREWDAATKAIAALLLSWPCELSVFLREANTQREARMKARGSEMANRASRLFVQAGLAESEGGGSWVPVSASSRRLRIKGAISTTPVATRRSQIMCLGIRPVQNSFGTNVLYEEVNKIFKSSSFGVVDGNALDKMRGKPTKGVEKWPMFFLELHLLGADETLAVDDVLLGSSQHSLQAIVDLLRVICYGFLKKHWMQPKYAQKPDVKSSRSHYTAQPDTLHEPKMAPTRLPSRARLAGEDVFTGGSARSPPFESWHRTKVGRSLPLLKSSTEHQEVQPTVPGGCRMQVRRRLVGENGKLLRKPFDDVDEEAQSVTQAETDDEPSEAVEQQRAMIASEQSGTLTPKSIPRTKDHVQTCQPVELQPKLQPHEWLQDILGSWKNPVFETIEKQIPALPQNPVHTERHVDVRGDGQRSRFFLQQNEIQFEAISMDLSGRLSRCALEKAKVIGQVDKKFILLQLPLRMRKDEASESSSALVMLDQHAADERCRLEELMSLYFLPSSQGLLQAVTEPLQRPIVFEISARENHLLRHCHAHLQTWGIFLESNTTKHTEGNEVLVSRLPPSISERCQSDPKLVIELVRKEIWKLEDRAAPPRPTYEPGRSWVSCFHSCPQGILELLHSRSCRSAIMFNDELSLDDCEQLAHRLSQCAFPFQCAHGRPSMAPLVDFGSGTGRLGSWSEGLSAPRVVQWRKWLNGT